MLKEKVYQILKDNTKETNKSYITSDVVKLVNEQKGFEFTPYHRVKYALDKLYKENKVSKAYSSSAHNATNYWTAEFAKCYLTAIRLYKTDKQEGINTLIEINKEHGVEVNKKTARTLLEQAKK